MLQSEPIWFAVCDSCGSRCEYDEYAGYTDKDIAREYAIESDWRHSEITGLDHCPECNYLCELCGQDAGDDAGEREYLCTDCHEIQGVPLPTIDGKPDPAYILTIDSFSSTCGNCRGSVNPRSKTCDVLLGYGPENGSPGCGTRWRYVASGYVSGDAVEAAKRMRPDLVYVGIWPGI